MKKTLCLLLALVLSLSAVAAFAEAPSKELPAVIVNPDGSVVSDALKIDNPGTESDKYHEELLAKNATDADWNAYLSDLNFVDSEGSAIADYPYENATLKMIFGAPLGFTDIIYIHGAEEAECIWKLTDEYKAIIKENMDKVVLVYLFRDKAADLEYAFELEHFAFVTNDKGEEEFHIWLPYTLAEHAKKREGEITINLKNPTEA